ncbi:hypothetical protein F5J12DRAFT_710523 [Pisolithus orientalis]|uniref:uncharacterized protein n=1 Tax=Pisolithus orientalis TaxID=936130 RepID=UPI0022253CA6|nr:uncharacterized protein F5J12DRAFT_710523 [Pisolithus orientalis]KAI6034954.1 hypothetical protein F5J12DRAFT_710523 [Pisolithus orientalis]
MFASFCHVASVSAPLVRTLASLPRTALTPQSAIYVSTSSNPYFNLTLEDWLFRRYPAHAPLLLLYRNNPCVVIGRNQNPWKEVNLHVARERNVPWIRRRSGGGTVFHDLENTNYSIHVPRASFDRAKTANIVVRALRALGVEGYANERNDICVGGKKMGVFLRSAYKIVSSRAYHHGTMLISTRLDTLGELLRVDKPMMNTKGVESVRSPVCNLVESNPRITHEAFVEAVTTSFRKEYDVGDEPCVVGETPVYAGDEYFKVGMAELLGWDWAYGQTPEFEYVLEKRFRWGDVTSTIRSKHGVILSCTFISSTSTNIQATLDELGRRLEGKRYGFVHDAEIFSELEEYGSSEMAESEAGELWRWLQAEMKG